MTDTITPEQALKNLIRWYVNLLETGRDRIIAAGGDCDPVDKMEASDPYLREARAALAQQAEQVPCEWSFSDDDSGTWSSSCGELWSFIDGGPKENRVSYCHHCGKPVKLAAAPKGGAL